MKGAKLNKLHPQKIALACLDQIIEWRGKPKALCCDNGRSKLTTWAENNGIELLFIQPGNPQQNSYIERYNRTVRHEYLEMNEFTSVEHAQDEATKWLWTYNNERSNMALGGITPAMKLKNAA